MYDRRRLIRQLHFYISLLVTFNGCVCVLGALDEIISQPKTSPDEIARSHFCVHSPALEVIRIIGRVGPQDQLHIVCRGAMTRVTILMILYGKHWGEGRGRGSDEWEEEEIVLLFSSFYEYLLTHSLTAVAL